MAGFEQGLARDAADSQASAAELLVFIDARGIEPELSGSNCGDVSSWATTDNYNVVFVRLHVCYRYSLSVLVKWYCGFNAG
jgi:hypothetical protein